jgi:hypothetical protein
LFLRFRDVIVRATKLHQSAIGVVQGVGGAGVIVTRLPDRSRVNQELRFSNLENVSVSWLMRSDPAARVVL